MRLVLGVSADGYLSKGPTDQMRWLGLDDKKVFRLLTSVGGTCGAGSTTIEAMPDVLAGRRLVRLSREGLGMTLLEFHNAYRDGWLLGGPTMAMLALEQDLVTEVHLCRSDRRAFDPGPDPTPDDAQRDQVSSFLRRSQPRWTFPCMSTTFGDTTVEVWRRAQR